MFYIIGGDMFLRYIIKCIPYRIDPLEATIGYRVTALRAAEM